MKKGLSMLLPVRPAARAHATGSAPSPPAPVDGPAPPLPAPPPPEDTSDDPLDAFMSSVHATLASVAPAARPPVRVQRLNEEEEEPGAGFVRHLDARSTSQPGGAKRAALLAAAVTAGSGRGEAQYEGPDSEDDDEAEETEEEVNRGGRKRRRVEALDTLLAPVQHDALVYPALHPCVVHSEEQAAVVDGLGVMRDGDSLRAAMGVTAVREGGAGRASGAALPLSLPDPAQSFMHLGLDLHSAWPGVLRVLSSQGWESPTPIQAQAVPALLGGWNVLGLAATGSGKTLAYALPAVLHAWCNRGVAAPSWRAGGAPSGCIGPKGWDTAPSPLVLVLTPTRELATQVHDVTRKLARGAGLSSVLVVGGASKWGQACALRDAAAEGQWGPHVVVATPGRLIDHARDGSLSLLRTSFLVMDEADRLLDLGFGPQVRAVCDAVRRDVQVAMFSATWPGRVQALATSVTGRGHRSGVRVAVGQGAASGAGAGGASTIVQRLVAVEAPGKWAWLQASLPTLLSDAAALAEGDDSTAPVPPPRSSEGGAARYTTKAIIFVSSKAAADHLTASLNGSVSIRGALGVHPAGRAARGLHGDHAQVEREAALTAFRSGAVPLLVATDVASRGLDIPNVGLVVSYDAARSFETHVHRIGRTGRLQAGGRDTSAGVKRGLAVTLLAHTDAALAAALVAALCDEGEGAGGAGTSHHDVPPAVLHLAARGGGGSGREAARSHTGGRGWPEQRQNSGLDTTPGVEDAVSHFFVPPPRPGELGVSHRFLPAVHVQHTRERGGGAPSVPPPTPTVLVSDTLGEQQQPPRKKSRWDGGGSAPAPSANPPPPAQLTTGVLGYLGAAQAPLAPTMTRALYQPGMRY